MKVACWLDSVDPILQKMVSNIGVILETRISLKTIERKKSPLVELNQ
jgi:hypothetical protein